CVFFFQAEDGIRDLTVTGVQTCALPISVCDDDVRKGTELGGEGGKPASPFTLPTAHISLLDAIAALADQSLVQVDADDDTGRYRSEERRVGKERGAWGGPAHSQARDQGE